MNHDLKNKFLLSASEWICNEYYLEIRYFSVIQNDERVVLRASISLYPLPPATDNSFKFKSELFLIGQVQRSKVSKDDLVEIIQNACNGKIKLEDEICLLKGAPNFSYHSEILHGDRWSYNLHLRVNGQSVQLPNQLEILQADNMLRAGDPPFDGLEDVLMWLGFDGAQSLGSRSSDINIWINPPVDIISENCSLSKDKLKIYLKSSPGFNVKQVNLAVKSKPAISIKSRKQLANEIVWAVSEDGHNQGFLEATLESADSVLVMLLIGNHIVRKQIFLDPDKARNNRFLAIQIFDKDLKMVRKSIFDSLDSVKFEKGIALLFYMLGFAPVVQIETDSPDLIVSTPEGHFIIIECTTRTADFSAKLGKLVDRRGALIKALQDSGHHSMVHAVLVCGLPRDQIAVNKQELKEGNVILLTKESLDQVFERVRHESDLEILVKEAENQMISNFID